MYVTRLMNTYLCVIVSKTKRQLPVLGNSTKKLNTKKTPPRMPVARPHRACRQSSSPDPVLRDAAVSVSQCKDANEASNGTMVSPQSVLKKELEALKAEMKKAKIERDLQTQMHKDQVTKIEAEYAAFKASRGSIETPAPQAAHAIPVAAPCPAAQSSQHPCIMTPQHCGIMSHYGGSMPQHCGSMPENGGSLSHYGGSMPHYGGSMPHYGGSLPHYGGSMPHYGGSMTHYGGCMSHYGGSMPQFGGMHFAPYAQSVNDTQRQIEHERAHMIIQNLQQEVQNFKTMNFLKYGSGCK